MTNIDWDQLQTAEDKARAEQEAEIAAARAAAIATLAQTDWYVTRQIETGAAIPEEIAQARDAARKTLA